MVHFYRNVFTKILITKARDVTAMHKAMYAQEDWEASIEETEQVIEKLKVTKLPVAAKGVE